MGTMCSRWCLGGVRRGKGLKVLIGKEIKSTTQGEAERKRQNSFLNGLVYLCPYSWLPVRNVDERGSSTRVSGLRRHGPPGHLCHLAKKVSCPSVLSQMK
jgi:hypothetical protein